MTHKPARHARECPVRELPLRSGFGVVSPVVAGVGGELGSYGSRHLLADQGDPGGCDESCALVYQRERGHWR